MKKLLFLLFAFSFAASAQIKLTVRPAIQMTILDSVHCAASNDTLRSAEIIVSYSYDSVLVLTGSDTVKILDLPLGKASSLTVGGTIGNDTAFGKAVTIEEILDSATIIVSDTAVKTDSTDELTFYNHGPFYHLTAGMRIQGSGIPWGTTIESKKDSLTLILTNACTTALDTAANNAMVELVSTTAYSAGDALGPPMFIGYPKKISHVYVTDDAKQITAVKLIFFSGQITETLDNAAFNPSDSDVDKAIGYWSLATYETLSGNTVITHAATTQPLILPGDATYVQAVVVGTPTFSATNNLTFTFIME